MAANALPWHRTDGATIAMRIAASVAQAIVEQRLDPGTLLTEVELAAEHGASRTPAREAMLQLQEWRLVRLQPKKGGIVTAITATERRDLLAVRTMFEADAVRSLAARPEALAALGDDLRTILERQEAALADASPLTFASEDTAFHARIVAASGNAVATALLATIAPPLARLTVDVALHAPDARATLLAEHRALADVAAAGDAERFGTLVREHVRAWHFGDAR